MAKLRVGFIGTGDERSPGPLGYGMNHQHAKGYQLLADQVEMVACCDLQGERVKRFSDMYGVPNTYSDYHAMLTKEKLDLVSISTWPHTHCQIVLDTIAAGVKAIHCEKPMAFTWGECKTMVAAAERAKVKLTFNHQRRFGAPFRQAKAILDSGRIGELQQIQWGAGDNYDYGSHNWDMASYLNDHVPVKWVLAQVHYTGKNLVFDVHNENQALAMWQYENGVHGLMATGPGKDFVACHHRIIGSKGEIAIGPNWGGSVLQLKTVGEDTWQDIDCGSEHCHGPGYIERAIADVVQAILYDTTSELCGANALLASEPMFAAWESARQRSRIDLPLTYDGNALDQMVKDGIFPV